jgi:hypothetical protein
LISSAENPGPSLSIVGFLLSVIAFFSLSDQKAMRREQSLSILIFKTTTVAARAWQQPYEVSGEYVCVFSALA